MSDLVSGGLNRYSHDAEQHTKRMYEQIRKRHTDCINVARNSGFSLEQITIIKNYIFKDCHELSYGYVPFEPSYEIAESWRRLSEKSGKYIQQHDIMLLYHELNEIILLITTKCSQRTAHNESNKKYNYQLASEMFYRSRGQ